VWRTAATIDQRRELYRKMRECERKVKIGRRPDFDGSQAGPAGRRVRLGASTTLGGYRQEGDSRASRPPGPEGASTTLSGLSTGQGGAAPSARGELSIARSRPCSCATNDSGTSTPSKPPWAGQSADADSAPIPTLGASLIPNCSPSASSISHSTDLWRFRQTARRRGARARLERRWAAAAQPLYRCSASSHLEPPYSHGYT